MKKTIQLLKKNDELTVIDAELDIYLEIPHLAYAEIKKKDVVKHFFLQML